MIMPFFQSSYNRFDIVDSDPDMAIDGFYADLEPLLQLANNSIDGISADTGQSSKFKSVNEFWNNFGRLLCMVQLRCLWLD